MAKLADLLAQVNAKEASIAQLREAHKDEYTLMGTVAEDSHKNNGLMDTKDALAGDDIIAKLADFEQRTKELNEIGKFLESQDQALAAMKVMRNPSTPAPSDTKQSFVGDRKETPAASVATGTSLSFAQKMLDSAGFKAAVPSNQLPSIGNKVLTDHNEIVVNQPFNDALGSFKAFQITTPLPTDVVAMPYPMRVQPLDYIQMRAEPGAIIFFHRPAAPTTNTEAPPRMRSATLDERGMQWTRVPLTKESLGNWEPLAHEDINDNASVMAVAAEQLLVDVKYQIVNQLFNGNGTAPNWDGMVRHLTSANGNTAAVPTASGTAPNYDNLGSVHPTMAVENAMTRIWERGMFPTVVFCNREDYIAIRTQQRLERYVQPDYKQYPMGDVNGVPLCLTDQLPANTLVVADTDPRNMEIVMGQDITTAVSDDFQFSRNQRSIRVVCYGNFAFYRLLAGYSLTATNNLRVVRGV